MSSTVFGRHSGRALSYDAELKGLSNGSSVNATAVLAMEERHTIQVMAVTTSSISNAAVLLALYWFFMMRRNFRRDLVLLLIIGDFWKSMVYWLFSIISFVQGPVKTKSHFCQATGFFLTQGLESCDMAILLMSLHMYLQIFPPVQSFLGSDGLYRVRYWVAAAWLLLPALMASLAFVNPTGGYQAVGAFCTLPIRPYWYRLALMWIPRYVMWIFVMGVAVRIYRHVGQEFRVFGHEQDGSASIQMPGASSVAREAATQFAMSQRRRSTMLTLATMDDDVAPDDKRSMGKQPMTPSQHSLQDTLASQPTSPATASRRRSSVNWSASLDFLVEPLTGPASPRSANGSRRPSRTIAPGIVASDFAPTQDAGGNATANPNRHRGSVTTLGSAKSAQASSPDLLKPLEPIRENPNRPSTSAEARPAPKIGGKVLHARRRAIQRQLRLLFIYPVIYMILWVIPFVNHAMSYSDYYAQHPVFPISAMSTFCQCFMGFADVCVFCWREKPWRHIPGSDGTFSGSFCFWRFCLQPEWTDRMRQGSRAPSDLPEESINGSISQDEKIQTDPGMFASFMRKVGVGKEPSLADRQPSVVPSVASRINRRVHSGGSDRKQLEADLAHQRLAMERRDWQQQRRGLLERRDTGLSSHAPGSPPPPGSPLGDQHFHFYARASRQAGTEWWERQHENDLFNDDDDEEEEEKHSDGHASGSGSGSGSSGGKSRKLSIPGDDIV